MVKKKKKATGVDVQCEGQPRKKCELLWQLLTVKEGSYNTEKEEQGAEKHMEVLTLQRLVMERLL